MSVSIFYCLNKLFIIINDELRSYVFVLSFFIFSATISAQQPNFKFNHLNLEDGHSNLNISSFAKDELGFIWIGTEDGLNRYDGTNLKVFK
jgi:ligand-binding sensor domain-containing protein